jgi:ribosome-interacting GTPase 1
LNKIDQISIEELDIIDRCPHYVPISARDDWNLDGLMDTVWEYLSLQRIYTKPKGQVPDYDAPVIIKNGASIEDFCNSIHKGLMKEFRHALVWGTSVKHNP